MVEFVDGSTLAQASPPDMRLPIALGLGWPDRVPGAAAGCDWTTAATWEFLPLDDEAFPAVRLAAQAGAAGGTAPAVYNAANEECVDAFLAGGCRSPASSTRSRGCSTSTRSATVRTSSSDVLAAEAWARASALRELDVAVTDRERPPHERSGSASLVFALGILVSVCLHEAGHLVTAKRFGMKATQYFVGFGPTLWSFRRGETEYGVKAIPAGGFVQIVGMTPLRGRSPPADQHRGVLAATRCGSAPSCSPPARRCTSCSRCSSSTPPRSRPACRTRPPQTFDDVDGPAGASARRGRVRRARTTTGRRRRQLRACRASDPAARPGGRAAAPATAIVAVDGKRGRDLRRRWSAIRGRRRPARSRSTYARDGAGRARPTADLVAAQRPALDDPRPRARCRPCRRSGCRCAGRRRSIALRPGDRGGRRRVVPRRDRRADLPGGRRSSRRRSRS